MGLNTSATNRLSRRSFIGASSAVAAAGAVGLFPTLAAGQQPATHKESQQPAFSGLIKNPAHAKQVYDITAIGAGKFLNNIKNSLNGLQFGFGIASSQIKVVAALHGPSNMLNYSDYVWDKYKLGEWLKVDDPKTGKPATRNVFLPAKTSNVPAPKAEDMEDESSWFQDTSIQTLQSRGVQFLSCHTAALEQSRALAKLPGQTLAAGDILSDILAHVLPGVLIVPSMVAAIALLQTEGHYSYITIS